MIEMVKSKEELLDLLKVYREELNKEEYEYINSLIDLEFSALQNYISDETKRKLLNNPIYKEAVVYNIYNKTKNILSKYDEVTIDDSESLMARVDDKVLYDFKYNRLRVSDDKKICSIDLYTTDFSEDVREKEIERVFRTLDRLNSEVNPFSLGKSGYRALMWDFTHDNEIKRYEKMLEEYGNLDELTDEDKKRMCLYQDINGQLLEELGLSFNKEDRVIDMTRTKMREQYIKKLPDVSVRKNVEYL